MGWTLFCDWLHLVDLLVLIWHRLVAHGDSWLRVCLLALLGEARRWLHLIHARHRSRIANAIARLLHGRDQELLRGLRALLITACIRRLHRLLLVTDRVRLRQRDALHAQLDLTRRNLLI